MAPSGHCAVFSCSGFRGNNYDKSSKGAIFVPFRPFYYFSRLEISFAFLFQNDWLAWEVSYERKSFFSDVLSRELESEMRVRRSYKWKREIHRTSLREKDPLQLEIYSGGARMVLSCAISIGEQDELLFYPG